MSLKPRIKPIYPVYRLDPQTFRIGAQLGITVELADPAGHGWALVNLMDGTRTVAEVTERMQAEFPEVSGSDVGRFIAALDAEGVLEDARRVPAHDERWGGNVNYFRHYARLGDTGLTPQERLRGAHVVVLGLGGGGSTILPILAATGVGSILGVDYDRVERSNLNRQFLFRESDVGSLKTEAAERVMAEINSDVAFTTKTLKVEASEDVAPLVRGADLVICALDEPPFLAQRRVNRACVEEGVRCVYGFSQVSRGRVFTVLPHDSGCVDCLNLFHSKRDPRFVAQFAGFHEVDFSPPTIAFSPDIVRLCGTIVAEAVRVLTGYAPPKSIATQFEVDLEADSAAPLLDWPRYPDECPTCGTGREADWPVFASYPGSVSRAERPDVQLAA
jgi:molybdopterin/thiamine biosynthesis adenylyltransferase